MSHMFIPGPVDVDLTFSKPKQNQWFHIGLLILKKSFVKRKQNLKKFF